MVLIFEDNKDLAIILKRLINSICGKVCITCSKVEDAENEVLAGNVDLIVSDLNIFGKNEGLMLIRRIRKIMPYTCPPIVVYTGLNPTDMDFHEAEKISDLICEKGETSVMELCSKLKKMFFC